MAYKYNWELLIYCSSYKINRCECTWIVRFSFLCLRFSFVCLVSLKCRMRVCKRVSYITTHITQINLSCAGWYWLRKRLSNGRQLWKTPRTFFSRSLCTLHAIHATITSAATFSRRKQNEKKQKKHVKNEPQLTQHTTIICMDTIHIYIKTESYNKPLTKQNEIGDKEENWIEKQHQQQQIIIINQNRYVWDIKMKINHIPMYTRMKKRKTIINTQREQTEKSKKKKQ